MGVTLLPAAIPPMQSRYFAYRSTPDAPPTQFWEIHIFSFSYLTCSRSADSPETSHTLEFNSVAECEAAALEAIATITQQGYQEVGVEPAAPAPQAAVLGGRSPQQTAVVLGGLEGLKQRLTSSSIEDLLRALPDAPPYCGASGISFL